MQCYKNDHLKLQNFFIKNNTGFSVTAIWHIYRKAPQDLKFKLFTAWCKQYFRIQQKVVMCKITSATI